MHCFYCEKSVAHIRDCNSRKAAKSVRKRKVGNTERNACRLCDSILNFLDECVGAVRIYIHLGEQMGYGIGISAAIGYIRKMEIAA